MTPRRVPVFVVIAVVLAALGFADHNRSEPRAVGPVAPRALMPVASPAAAVSSSFFCAGGTAEPNAVFDSTIVVANPNPSPVDVTVTAYPAALPSDQAGSAAVAAMQPTAKPVTVGARARAEVHLADLQASPFVAALVETSDADIAVERRVTGSRGTSSTPCASAPSSSWYVPTGTTTRDASELLALFNPFPVDAVVDITFQTNDGFRAPTDLQALPVPGGHVRIVDVAATVPRLEQLAGFVTARSGEVVVDRMQTFDGSDPNHPAGAAVTAGAPAAAPVWTFPNGAVNDALTEAVTVVNPGDSAAQVQLEVVLDDPATNGVVDPIPVTVQPHGYTQVAMQDQTRVPKGVAHAIVVRSLSGPDVVAERVLRAAPSGSRSGYGATLGSPLEATSWLFADGSAVAGTAAEFLIVFNPRRDAAARLSVTALAQGQSLAIDGLSGVEIPAGARVTIELGQHINRADLPVVVDASSPVVIERGLFPATGIGLSLAMGMPLSSSTAAIPNATTTTTSLPLPR